MKWCIFFFVSAALIGVLKSEILIENKFSDGDKKLIVDYHNDLRKLVADGMLVNQPKATEMLKLKWDNELSKVAQDWADKMKLEHNDDRSDTFKKRFSVGENIHFTISPSNSNSNFEWIKAIDRWFDEHQYYTHCPIGKCPPAKAETGHYTQIIWAKTEFIGCGNSYFKDKDGKMFTKFYVCNYGMAGNWFGEYPYKTEHQNETKDDL